jgi:ferritin-like metal-binding protein YciE
MRIETLEQLLQDEIRDIYDAEKQLVKAIPKMAKAASSSELEEALKHHLEQTQGQVQRLEQVFEALGTKAKGKTCAGMKGLIEEGQEAIGVEASGELKDLAIIGAAQRVEHYEIAAYGTARTFAERLGNQDVVDLLQETLDEEKEADEKLSEISGTLLEGVSESEEEEEETAGATIGRGSETTKPAGAQKTRRNSGM